MIGSAQGGGQLLATLNSILQAVTALNTTLSKFDATPTNDAITSIKTALDGIKDILANFPQIVPAPASDTAPGVAGSLAIGSGFLYVCTATDTWRRVALVDF